MSDWTEVKISVSADDVDRAGDIAMMAVPYGIYIEDYRDLEQQAWDIAHIDLIDEALLQKDRSKAFVHIYISPEESPMEAVAFLRERLTAEGIAHEIDLSACRKEEWENNWKQYFHTMEIGERLIVKPKWEPLDDPKGRAVLSIEPGLAFGSGTHETTRLCLTALEQYITPDTTVLDVGCGSGILSVAALLLGAKRAVGVDIDALAVKTAIENGAENGFVSPRYTVLRGNLTAQVSGQFDVIVANIVADVIISFCADVGQYLKPGGVFITSGIIDTREADVLAAFARHGFRVKNRRCDKGWVCFESSADGQ
ncbi:MAG: 50S ribosomal protein L11 methyltransferase [Clostridia bacterium]|nr:50S ribosomal protein L11 methyltransferase [Clostridia bacterium]